MVDRVDMSFQAEDGLCLRGWLFIPKDRRDRRPAITMAHGFAAVKDHGLERFAVAFAEAGFVVLVHDHRNFGASDGEERGDIDPGQQIADWRRAISFLETRPEVNSDRIGIWGSSYAGGHVIVLGATDRRLRAVVSQVPTISGFEQGRRRVAPELVAGLEKLFQDDERRRFNGEPPMRWSVVKDDKASSVVYQSEDAKNFYLQPTPSGVWDNSVTFRSLRAARMYEPGIWISRVSPTPLLMVVALADTITPTDLALEAYEKCLQPKRLETIQGGHFDPYFNQFPVASQAALQWFQTHLQ